MKTEEIAKWAFVAFVFIAIIMGLELGYMEWNVDPNYSMARAYVTLVMLIIGVIVGLISITAKEVMPFLIATVALIVASASNVWSPLGTIHPLLYYWTTEILRLIVAFAAPAAVINGVKAVFVMAREK